MVYCRRVTVKVKVKVNVKVKVKVKVKVNCQLYLRSSRSYFTRSVFLLVGELFLRRVVSLRVVSSFFTSATCAIRCFVSVRGAMVQ